MARLGPAELVGLDSGYGEGDTGDGGHEERSKDTGGAPVLGHLGPAEPVSLVSENAWGTVVVKYDYRQVVAVW